MILDAEQRILSFELTQHGKRELARGRFRPSYYTFHDSLVNYDVQNGNETILTNSFYMTPLYLKKSVDNTSLFDIDIDYRLQDEDFTELEYFKNSVLGETDSGEYSPSVELNFYDGEISSFTKDGVIYNLDLADTETEVFLNIREGELDVSADDLVDDLSSSDLDSLILTEFPFEDSSFIEIRPSGIFLELKEENQTLDNLIFGLEVFEIGEESGSEEFYPLVFQEEQTNIVNGLFVSEKPLRNFDQEVNKLERLFDIQSDYEIDDNLYCKYNIKVIDYNVYTTHEVTCDDLQFLRSDEEFIIDGPLEDDCD